MGFDKLAAPLSGVSVLERSLRAIEASPWIGEIILVCPRERWERIGGIRSGAARFVRVEGGAERHDSVMEGLACATLTLACVHDGARPLVAASDLNRCIAEALQHGAASLAHRVVDTICRGGMGDFVEAGIDRNGLWAMETPQCAPVRVLSDALQAARAAGAAVTDETSALGMAGVRVKLVESAFPNPKITIPSDLRLAEALIS